MIHDLSLLLFLSHNLEFLFHGLVLATLHTGEVFQRSNIEDGAAAVQRIDYLLAVHLPSFTFLRFSPSVRILGLII